MLAASTTGIFVHVDVSYAKYRHDKPQYIRPHAKTESTVNCIAFNWPVGLCEWRPEKDGTGIKGIDCMLTYEPRCGGGCRSVCMAYWPDYHVHAAISPTNNTRNVSKRDPTAKSTAAPPSAAMLLLQMLRLLSLLCCRLVESHLASSLFSFCRLPYSEATTPNCSQLLYDSVITDIFLSSF